MASATAMGGEVAEGLGTVPKAGDVAPPFDLPGLGGGRVRVPDPDGRAVLLSFLRHAG